MRLTTYPITTLPTEKQVFSIMSLLAKLKSLEDEICNPLWQVRDAEFIASVDHYSTFRIIVVRGIFEISISETGLDQVLSTSLTKEGEGVYKASGITTLYY